MSPFQVANRVNMARSVREKRNERSKTHIVKNTSPKNRGIIPTIVVPNRLREVINVEVT
eukprot:CAMPEP_0116870744 /NCGR_PEP_ID=MMETSP0463-20121206/800_1 /TAXON_ID=181622 /ORGANISM="Strombidinopsis sp, Strain SopsisLIS2011" /LENGTH=58 /DNA_ID=CAMNT_0004507883 /DNA_START=798 /DNA_END=974 /DNA_ORIENTATION=-